jgi:hypothetical protein
MSKEKIKLPPVLENTDAAVDIMNGLVIPTVQKNRCMAINALLGLGVVFMAFGFAYVLPLKEVKPYIIFMCIYTELQQRIQSTIWIFHTANYF